MCVLILAIAPASALAGGFATVGLSSTPEGIAPGEPWVAELTILQHGRSETALDGLEPTLTVAGSDGERRTFRASPTGEPGVYRARVVFPSAGTWSYRVNDGFAGAIEFPPVQIGGSSASAGGSEGGRSLHRASARRGPARRGLMARLPLLVAAVGAAVAFGAVMLLSSSESREPVRVASSTPGLDVFNRMGCGSCHRLAAAGSNGPFGPNLDERLGSHTAKSLKTKIIAPGGTSVMPSDFAERMDDDELDALVSFLLASRDGGKPE